MHPDDHIKVQHGFHSVPQRLTGRRVAVRPSHRMIEIFHDHEEVALPHRRGQRGGHGTVKEHMGRIGATAA